MQALARFGGIVAFLALSATASAAQDPFVAIVRPVLAAAPANYASLHTAKSATNHYDYTTYALTPAFAELCKHCTVTDEYGTAKHPERWVTEFSWYYPQAWTADRVAKNAIALLTPLMHGYTLRRNDDGGRVYLEWDGPHGTWLYLATNDTDVDDPGFDLRIGHDLTKSAHMLIVPPLTPAMQSALTTSLGSFLRLGLGDAANNFTSMRGAVDKKFYKPGDFEPYACATSFEPQVTDCQITGMLNYAEAKWMLEGRTIAVGGTPEQARALVHSIVEGALPGSFTPDTDPKYLMTDDYRWDDTTAHLSVSYNSNIKDGKTTFDFSIYHFLE